MVFAATGELVSERAGLVGIHTEGMMLSAALAGVLVSGATGSAWLGVVAGIVVAMLLGLVFAGFTVGLGEDGVVVGTGLNLLALGVTRGINRVALGDTGRLATVARASPLVLVLGLGLVALAGWGLFRTRLGLALRASGESPTAVTSAGFSVGRLRTLALVVAGGFAGLGGAYLSLGITPTFSDGMTSGRGFVAIALVAFGRWRPSLVVLGALLVGSLDALQYRMQGGGAPPQVLRMLPYLATFGVLLLAPKGRGGAPAALGRAYKG